MTLKNYSLFTIDQKEDGHYIRGEHTLDKKDIQKVFSLAEEKGINVITDPFEYQGTDQVLPIQPEQIFFMDELNEEKMKGAKVLEIGLGSGVLSIFCAKNGADKVVGLDINPRAKNFTGFNSVLNGVEDQIEIRDGSMNYVFESVKEDKFDYIISNPPFEPTPPGMDYYMNSAAGIYGLDFLEMLFKDVDSILNDGGYLQFVTMAPGNSEEPFLLRDLLNKYFPGRKVDVAVDTQPIGYEEFNERFTDFFGIEQERVDRMNEIAQKEGVTDIYMCMVHFTKGEEGEITFAPTKKVYETWDTPLGCEESNNYVKN